MQFPNLEYRQWLAEAMLSLETKSMGLPPSLLGANAEAIPVPLQIPTPIAADERLRVANLAQGSRHEFLVVNSSAEEIVLRWASAPGIPLRWSASHGRPPDLTRIPAGGWIRGLSE